MDITINLSILIIGMLLIILNWILNTSFNIVSYTISQYAYGKYGFLTTIGFLLIGIGAILISIGMGANNIWLYKIVQFLVFGYGLCIGLLAFFRTDKPGESTIRGKLHNILAITGLISLTINMIVFMVYCAIDHVFSLCTVLLFIPNLISLLLLQFGHDKYRGIYERGAMFSQYFWLIYLLIN